jgi:adenine-specific DNA-methyltransferase
LFIAQDAIDAKRDGLIGDIEKQLTQQHHVEPLFSVRWSVV